MGTRSSRYTTDIEIQKRDQILKIVLQIQSLNYLKGYVDLVMEKPIKYGRTKALSLITDIWKSFLNTVGLTYITPKVLLNLYLSNDLSGH